jgi:hypothetical protein
MLMTRTEPESSLEFLKNRLAELEAEIQAAPAHKRYTAWMKDRCELIVTIRAQIRRLEAGKEARR